MMRSLYSGVSGVKGHQTRMDVVGNNIANVNTTGFKSGRVTFADTLSQTTANASAATGNLGGTNPKQIGLGVGVASIDTIFTDGSVQATGKNTDVALSGNGLFVVKSGNETYYTRDGAFEFDEKGNYVLPGSGHFVQGWTANNGVLNTNGSVGNIQIQAGKSMASKATTVATYQNNLDAAEETVLGMKITDAKGNSITLDPTNTNPYTIGDNYTSTVRKMAITFASGISIPSATGQYAVNSSYQLDTTQPFSVNLANGDTIAVQLTPTKSTATWRVGSDVPSNMNSANSYVGSATAATVTMEDGSVLTNNSGTTYDIELQNGDVIQVAAGNTNTYTVNQNAPTANITAIKGNKITLDGGTANEAILINNSNTPYSVGDGTHTIEISSSSTKTYDATNPGTLTITSVSGTRATLDDGSTLVLTSTQAASGIYVKGYSFNFNATIMPAFTQQNVMSIRSENPSAITRMSGTVISGDGTTDTFTATSGYIVPSDGLKVSEMTLTDSLGSSIKVSNTDTTPYKVGSNYNSAISSLLLNMSDGTTSTQTSGKYTIGYSLPLTTTLTVYDTLGNAHSVVVYFTKTKTDSTNGNQWTASVNVDGSGKNTITEQDGSTTTIEMSDTVLQFNTAGKYSDGSGTLNLTLTNGATAAQKLTIDVSKLTQFSGNNTVNGVCDGNAAGTLKSISIDSSGIITGTYTNGVSQSEAQIAVAQFTNASGLTKTGASLYQQSNNSGEPNVKTAKDLGVTMQASTLEMSNVDIANEFSDMIITQRGFQSNSKIITVSDEMLETMINMKR